MPKEIMLTIDDSPSADFMSKLDYLTERKIPAVLFCIGQLMEKRQPEIIEAIKRGYVIANHSWSHPHFSDCSLQECEAEILKTDQLVDEIYQAAGKERPARYFRFPYGDKGDGRRGNNFSWWRWSNKKRHQYIQNFLKSLGYSQPAFPNIRYRYMERAGLWSDIDWSWTFDIMEWAMLESKPTLGLNNISKVLTRLDQKRPTDCRGSLGSEARWLQSESAELLLLHDHEGTTEHFPRILEALEARGIQFISHKS